MSFTSSRLMWRLFAFPPRLAATLWSPFDVMLHSIFNFKSPNQFHSGNYRVSINNQITETQAVFICICNLVLLFISCFFHLRFDLIYYYPFWVSFLSSFLSDNLCIKAFTKILCFVVLLQSFHGSHLLTSDCRNVELENTTVVWHLIQNVYILLSRILQ